MESSRLANDQDLERLLRRSKAAIPLAPVKQYPDLQVEPIPEAVGLDEVNLEVGETVLKNSILKQKEEREKIVFKAAKKITTNEHSEQKTSQGIKQKRRGVGHLHPMRIIVGAWVFLLFRLTLVLVLIGMPLWILQLSLSGERPGFIVLLPLVVLLGLAILMTRTTAKARCTVCMQPIFANLRCLKNKRAHRFFFGNVIISTALKAAFTLSYRCPYCGTLMHLKGREKQK